MATTKKPVPEDVAAFSEAWEPVVRALVVWFILCAGTGVLSWFTNIGWMRPLPAMLVSIGIIVTHLVCSKRAEAGKRRRRQLRLYAESGLQVPDPEKLKAAGKLAEQRINQDREAFETVCRTSNVQALKPGEEEKSIPATSNWRCTVDGDVEVDINVARGNGLTIDDIRAHLRRFAAVADVKRVKLRRHPGTQSRATMTFLYTDPLERFNHVRDLRLPAIRGNLVIGITEHDEPAELPSNKPILVAGFQDAGKSSIGWSALASLMQQGIWTEVIFLDPKMMEFVAWKEQVDKGWLPNRVKVLAYASLDPDTFDRQEILDTIQFAHDRMQARAKQFGDDKVQNAVTEIPNSQENPYLLIINDELGDILDIEKRGSLEAWNRLKQKARAVGVGIIGSAITVNDSEMGAGRKLYGTRVGLRAEEGTAIALFGKDAVNRGAALHLISPDEPGRGYIVDPQSGQLVQFRGSWVPKSDRLRMAAGDLPENMGSGVPVDEDDDECFAYWLPNREGEVLYCGKAKDPWGNMKLAGDKPYGPGGRFAAHEKDKPWWHEVYWPRVRVFSCAGEKGALIRESDLIDYYHPIYNIQQNGDNPAAVDVRKGYEPRLQLLPDEVLEAEEKSLARRWRPAPRVKKEARRWPSLPKRRQVEESAPIEAPVVLDGLDGALVTSLRAARARKGRAA